jgi:hypothetical protein
MRCMLGAGHVTEAAATLEARNEAPPVITVHKVMASRDSGPMLEYTLFSSIITQLF